MSRATLAAGLALVALLVGAALLSWLWTPYPVDAIDIAGRLRPPSAAHWLGTDQLGRDVATLLLVGARTALAVSLLAVGAALAAGVPVGLLAAARGGWLDELAMRAGDLVFAFPSLMLAILLAAAMGPGTASAVAAIAIFNLPVFARLARNEARGLWCRDFVAAALVAGKGRARISAEHVLPNILPPILVQATIQVSLALIAEAGLSFVGLGVQPPSPSWGRMLADAQTLAGPAPRLALAPGGAIMLAVLGFTLTGDALRDRLGRDR